MATLLQLCQPFDHAVMAVIQQLSGAMMDKIMLVFTFLGEETFAILLLIAVYWCWDKRIGEYLLFSLYTAMSLNGLLKDIICRPRPFLNDEFSDLRYVKVKGLLVDTEHLSSSWSFPSGHSQTAGSIYGSLINGRKLGIKVCGIAVILLVMLSRVYLGVHYPTDTIVGAVLGLLVDTEHLSSSWSFPSGHSQTAGSIYGSLINGRKLGIKVCGIAVILLVMLSRVYLGVHYPTDTIVGAVLGLLCAWVCGLLFRRFYQHRLLLMAAAVLLSGLMLLVSPSGDSVKTLAMGVGAVLGMWLEDGLVEFRSANGFFGGALRLILGFALIMAIRIGLKALLPDMMWCHTLRYGLMGLFGTFLWPWVFTKLGF